MSFKKTAGKGRIPVSSEIARFNRSDVLRLLICDVGGDGLFFRGRAFAVQVNIWHCLGYVNGNTVLHLSKKVSLTNAQMIPIRHCFMFVKHWK